MEKFISQGKEYIFISNVDNLGATVDLGLSHFYHQNLLTILLISEILNFLVNQKHPPEFIMEVTDKTRSDVKVCSYWIIILTFQVQNKYRIR